jgi:anti-sigma B factor antagonist
MVESAHTDGKHCAVVIRGELDTWTAPLLRERLLEVLDRGCRNVVIDTSAVSFIDADSLGVIIEARSRAAADRASLLLTDPSGAVRRILDLTGLTDLLVSGQPDAGLVAAIAAEEVSW